MSEAQEAEAVKLMDSHFELRCALREAMNAVLIFHGEAAWEIYEKKAPEWQRWKRVLEKADSLGATT